MNNSSIYQQLGNKRLEQLDGLRGICSLAVVICHSFSIPFTGGLFIGYHKPQILIVFDAIGTISVLLFFVLSGFVIGYTTPLKYTNREARKYVLRRLIRLYPIYLFALFLTYFLSDKLGTIKINHVLGNVFFMESWLVPIESGNPPLWSLHYEFIFYLLYLLVWKFIAEVKPYKIDITILMCLDCSVLTIFFSFHFFAILGYFTIWLGGYWLSHKIDYHSLVNHDYLSYRFWSPIVLMVISVISTREIIRTLMFRFETPIPYPAPVFAYVILSVLCTSVVASLITKKKVPFYIASVVFILVLQSSFSLYVLYKQPQHKKLNCYPVLAV